MKVTPITHTFYNPRKQDRISNNPVNNRRLWSVYKSNKHWWVGDLFGCEIVCKNRGEASALCSYLNRNKIDGSIHNVDQIYQNWLKGK